MANLGWVIIVIIVLALILPTVVKFIKPGEVGLVLTFGRYSSTANPGVVLLIPGIQSILRVDLREQVMVIQELKIITQDNLLVAVAGIIYVQITDPYNSQYAIANVFTAVVNYTQTTLRATIGEMPRNEVISNRDILSVRMLELLDEETSKWGVKVKRLELTRVEPIRN